jgi:uncharacterized SAM-binding protein YcdF (DUF218 family)
VRRVVLAGGIAALLALLVRLDALPAMGEFLAPPLPPVSEPADWLVILGGGWEFREITGAELFLKGYAKRLLLTGIPHARDGRGFPVNVPRFDYLLAAGISPGRIVLDGSAKNTWDEAVLIRTLLKKSPGARRVIVVSDPPHLRRLDWVCRRVLAGAGIQYGLAATEPDWWSPAAWWRHPVAARFVVTEYLKLAFYTIRYRFAENE